MWLWRVVVVCSCGVWLWCVVVVCGCGLWVGLWLLPIDGSKLPCHLTEARVPLTQVKLAFHLCDVDGSSGVSLANLRRVLQLAQLTGSVGGASVPPEAARADCASSEPGAGREPPFLTRSESTMARDFARHDVDGDQRLDFEEWCTFLREHADVLHLSTSLVTERLAHVDLLLQPVEQTIQKIKRERSTRASTSRRTSTGGDPSSAALAAMPPPAPKPTVPTPPPSPSPAAADL